MNLKPAAEGAAAASATPAKPAASPSFGSLPLPPPVLENLERLGYTGMTPIQAASLPLALAGHDLIAQAKTGSGKTAAFALALLALCPWSERRQDQTSPRGRHRPGQS